MSGLTPKENKTFIGVLASAGDFRMTVPEGTEGAKKREYETSDGKTGSKWELSYKSIGGHITGIEFYDGDYGENLQLTFDFKNGDDPVVVSLGTATPFGEDMLKKLPNLDFSKEVKLTPYAFTDDNGKERRGISIIQEGSGYPDDKIPGAFYDPEKKESLLGFPEVEGDASELSKDEWKAHFLKCRIFLIKFAKDHIDEWTAAMSVEEAAEEVDEI